MSQQGTEVSEMIDARPLTGLQWRVVILCALVVFLDGYDIQVMALTVPSLVSEWSVSSEDFRWALAASLIGLGIGAAFLAPLGDLLGRRNTLIVSVGLVGASTVAAAFSGGVTDMFIWRCLTGLGLGTSVPNAVAMTSEFVPQRHRAALTALMYCNIALGAFAAGWLAPPLIDQFGWHATFLVGGFGPLVVAALFLLFAPESLTYLLTKTPGGARATAILRQIAPDIDPGAVYAKLRGAADKPTVLALLSTPYLSRTLLIWAIFSLNFFVLYFLISWLPTLLTDAGWSRARALQGAVTIQLGGVIGGLLMAWLVDRGYIVRTLVTGFVITTVMLGLFPVVPLTPVNWGAMLLVVGGGISGAQLVVTALAAMFYPPLLRGTGVGWATAIARSGAILGPVAGGWVIGMDIPAYGALGLLVVPVLLTALCAMAIPKVWPGPGH